MQRRADVVVFLLEESDALDAVCVTGSYVIEGR
jgi:hypothetical protein